LKKRIGFNLTSTPLKNSATLANCLFSPSLVKLVLAREGGDWLIYSLNREALFRCLALKLNLESLLQAALGVRLLHLDDNV